jgi:hypothetical protein
MPERCKTAPGARSEDGQNWFRQRANVAGAPVCCDHHIEVIKRGEKAGKIRSADDRRVRYLVRTEQTRQQHELKVGGAEPVSADYWGRRTTVSPFLSLIKWNRAQEAGVNMRLVGGPHCFLWGSLAALLYAGAANPDRDIDYVEVGTGVTHSDASLADPGLRAALPNPDLRAALPGPDAGNALTAPEVKAMSVETLDECPTAEGCIDQYLWSMYERARKVDTIKVQEPIKMTVKKKGHFRTVTKTVTKLVDEDFTWKDPQAAQRAGMSLAEYVIGGMDREFKVKLYHLFRAVDDAGLAPGMTSGFRDDYRQSIASGNRAATDRSYHGGSRRGGFGHGLAADLVSVKGETRSERWSASESLWKWIDAHGKEFGIGRPYLDRDPPHVAPIDGEEYANHRGVNAQRAGL